MYFHLLIRLDTFSVFLLGDTYLPDLSLHPLGFYTHPQIKIVLPYAVWSPRILNRWLTGKSCIHQGAQWPWKWCKRFLWMTHTEGDFFRDSCHHNPTHLDWRPSSSQTGRQGGGYRGEGDGGEEFRQSTTFDLSGLHASYSPWRGRGGCPIHFPELPARYGGTPVGMVMGFCLNDFGLGLLRETQMHPGGWRLRNFPLESLLPPLARPTVVGWQRASYWAGGSQDVIGDGSPIPSLSGIRWSPKFSCWVIHAYFLHFAAAKLVYFPFPAKFCSNCHQTWSHRDIFAASPIKVLSSQQQTESPYVIFLCFSFPSLNWF